MEQIIWGSWVVGGGREEVMCLWNGPPILIGGATKKWISILIGREQKALLPPYVNPSLTIFYMEITFHFFNLTSIHICGNSFLPKVTGMLTWLLFSPQNLSFWFKTRPIFCQTLRLWTFENYLLVESAFVVRNSRTLFSKLYHPCFFKIHTSTYTFLLSTLWNL